MKVKFYGHNCYVLSGYDANVIIDPWLSTKGAFFGSWFQWPLNHHLISNLVADAKKSNNTYIYISHEHQDHFDTETLCILRQHVDYCIIPEYYDDYLKTTITAMGFKVITLADSLSFDLGNNARIELLIVDTGVNHDSTAIIEMDGQTFVNQNDSKIFDRLGYISKRPVDYYAVQFSGATWHPVCYDYDDMKKEQISKKKIFSKFISIRNAIKLLAPTYYLPSAGPAVFPHLEESLSYGENNIFVHQDVLAKHLKNSTVQTVYLRPGQAFEDGIHNGPIAPPSRHEWQQLKAKLACTFDAFDSRYIDDEALQFAISERLQQLKGLVFEQCPALYLNWGRETFDGLKVDLNNLSVTRTNDITSDAFVEISAEPKYFNLMADKAMRWQDIYLSLRARIRRQPDMFNTFINIFLFSDVSNIRKAFETTLSINETRIVKQNPKTGKSYEINRYCPHNGADLLNADIDDEGRLMCPRHGWLFDLHNDGKCDRAKVSINAKEIVNTITLCETVSARLVKD